MGTKPMTVSEAIQTLRTLEGTWAAFRTLGDALAVAQDADTIRLKAEKAAADAVTLASQAAANATATKVEYQRLDAQAKSDHEGVMRELAASYLEQKTRIDDDLTARTQAAQSRIDELLFRIDGLSSKAVLLNGEKENLEVAVAKLKTTYASLKQQADAIQVE